MRIPEKGKAIVLRCHLIDAGGEIQGSDLIRHSLKEEDKIHQMAAQIVHHTSRVLAQPLPFLRG